MVNPLVPGYPVAITLPVQWGEQDAFGHVNNIVHLRWCESARIEYLRKVGLWETIAHNNVGPILAAITCNYRKPVEFPDQVVVGARVTSIGRTSFRMEHQIVCVSDGATAAEGDTVLVVFDYSQNRPVPVPDAVREAIEALEGRKLA